MCHRGKKKTPIKHWCHVFLLEIFIFCYVTFIWYKYVFVKQHRTVIWISKPSFHLFYHNHHHVCHWPIVTLIPSTVWCILISKLLNYKKMGTSALVKYGICILQIRTSCNQQPLLTWHRLQPQVTNGSCPCTRSPPLPLSPPSYAPQWCSQGYASHCPTLHFVQLSKFKLFSFLFFLPKTL